MSAAGKLDRRIQFRRMTLVDDGFARTEQFADHGSVLWAAKTDISDGERWRAGQVDAIVTTRFRVRSSPFTRGITPADTLVCEGVTYSITGIKEGEGRKQWLELTCAAQQGTAT